MIPFARLVRYGNKLPVLKIRKFNSYYGGFVLLSTDGKLYVKGTQMYGQFGLGNTTAVTKPTVVMNDVADFWISSEQMVVQKNDGTVWCSGVNLGSFGLSPVSSSTFIDGTAAISPGLSNAKDVKLSYRYGGFVVLKNTGDVQVLGKNSGTLGIPSATGTVTTWTTVATGVEEIKMSYQYTLAKKTDGSLWGWGINWAEAMIPGSSYSYITPTQIAPKVYDFWTDPRQCIAYITDTALIIRGYNNAVIGGVSSDSYPYGVNLFSKPQPFTFSTGLRFVKNSNTIWQSVDNCRMSLITPDGKYYASGEQYDLCLGTNDSISNVFKEIQNTFGAVNGNINTFDTFQQTNTVLLNGDEIYIAGAGSIITGKDTDNSGVFTNYILTFY